MLTIVRSIARWSAGSRSDHKTQDRPFELRKYPIASFFILTSLLGVGTLSLVILVVVPVSLALSSVLSVSMARIIMTADLDGEAGPQVIGPGR